MRCQKKTKRNNMPYFDHVYMYSDGGCKGNPGSGTIGIVIYDQHDNLLYKYSVCIGHCTNNQAEYKALIKGLELCAKYTRNKVTCYSDSELLIKQRNGQCRIRNKELKTLHADVLERARAFETVEYKHEIRDNERISQADKLGNEAYKGRPVDESLC